MPYLLLTIHGDNIQYIYQRMYYLMIWY